MKPHASIPNVLTIVRIVLVPVMVVLLFVDSDSLAMRIAATAIFSIAMATDFFDGMIARKYSLVSDFGKLWDPIADKALTGAAFVSLSILGELPWYFTIIILVREWGITLLRDYLKRGGVIMPANRGGKLKTTLQSLALFFFLLNLQNLPGQLQVGAWVVMWAAMILTLTTGFDYLKEAAVVLKDRRETEEKTMEEKSE